MLLARLHRGAASRSQAQRAHRMNSRTGNTGLVPVLIAALEGDGLPYPRPSLKEAPCRPSRLLADHKSAAPDPTIRRNPCKYKRRLLAHGSKTAGSVRRLIGLGQAW